MLKKSDILPIIKVGIILFLITGISAFVLGAANEITAPMIAVNEQVKKDKAMRKVMPQADAEDGFAKIDGAADEANGITEISAAKKDGAICGYVVMTEPKGYGGAITMAVGVDLEGKVTGIDITTHSETPGLGAKCTEEEFTKQFEGKGSGVTAVKSEPKENEIDTITSATITSKAVTLGVNNAIDAVNAVKEGK